jgi:hypothetical protein
LYTGKNPTPLANQFFIFRLDFSGITPKEPQYVMHSFLQKVNSGIKDFLNIYATYFQPNDIAILSQEHTPSGVLINFFDLVTMRGWLKDHKIDVMIDEYDQFTNQLLSYHSREFQKVVSEDDAVRVFYEVLKSISGSRK